jgi:hypothetical protein
MGIFGKLRGGAGAGRGDDAHGVTRNPFEADKTRSTGLNTRYNETQGKNEVGIHHGGPSSYTSTGTGKVFINMLANNDGGKTWVDEKSPAGKTQSKSDKRDAKALKSINKPKAMEKSRKAGQAYDAAKSAEDRVDNSWLKPGAGYMGSAQETSDKETVSTFKTGGIKATQKRMKNDPTMADDANDVRIKRILDERK